MRIHSSISFPPHSAAGPCGTGYSCKSLPKRLMGGFPKSFHSRSSCHASAWCKGFPISQKVLLSHSMGYLGNQDPCGTNSLRVKKKTSCKTADLVQSLAPISQFHLSVGHGIIVVPDPVLEHDILWVMGHQGHSVLIPWIGSSLNKGIIKHGKSNRTTCLCLVTKTPSQSSKSGWSKSVFHLGDKQNSQWYLPWLPTQI